MQMWLKAERRASLMRWRSGTGGLRLASAAGTSEAEPCPHCGTQGYPWAPPAVAIIPSHLPVPAWRQDQSL